ncbi:MAG: ATP-binding protein [Actinomycetota bacterium]|mgnify:CR=1 FL=1
MVDLQTLEGWLRVNAESETLEFKEAKFSFHRDTLRKYCVAIANEGGGYLIFGVSDQKPRQVVGSEAFRTTSELNEVKKYLLDQIGLRINIEEVFHSDGRVLVFVIPSRPVATPLHVDGAFLMRSGESLVPMSPDQLKNVLNESRSDWMLDPALSDLSPSEVVDLLDTQSIFELLELTYPEGDEVIVARLQSLKLISSSASGWAITNLGAIIGARKLSSFPQTIALRAPRFTLYDGISKVQAIREFESDRGLAVGFAALVTEVYEASPQNYLNEELIRTSAKVFPLQALRELIANAFVHQDFSITGASVMIDMYEDRVEISNPGLPSIEISRFIDEYQSRNERFANLMRRMRICEERGSGIDKVIFAAEVHQLPAPEFRTGSFRTTAVMFAPRAFAAMTRSDRIRACYQHCSIRYVVGDRMTNQTLRERFGLSNKDAATVSVIIAAAKDDGHILSETSATTSTRYARYVPFWAMRP